MEKKTVINASTCDVRHASEETLESMGQLVINAAAVLADAPSRALLARYPVTMNCARVLDVEGDVRFSSVNGSAQIKSSDVVNDKWFLLVNGSLEIGPDTQQVLAQYVGIAVNGSVTYPESLSGALGMLTVNGSTTCYPDGAILLKRNAVIDRLFALRAKAGLYWAGRRLILVDPQLDPAALAAKGARFASQEAIVAESKVEGVVELLDEKTEILIVPDGTAVIRDDVTLENGTVKKHGRKLYVIGDLTVDRSSAEALETLEYLHVRGDVLVTADLKERLLEKAEEITGDVEILKERGKTLRDRPFVKVSRWMLEREPEGVAVVDCAIVKLDQDLDKDLIAERLSISDCAVVRCTPDQEDAVATVSEDVAQIGGGDGDDGFFNPLNRDAKVINAADYVL